MKYRDRALHVQDSSCIPLDLDAVLRKPLRALNLVHFWQFLSTLLFGSCIQNVREKFWVEAEHLVELCLVEEIELYTSCRYYLHSFKVAPSLKSCK